MTTDIAMTQLNDNARDRPVLHLLGGVAIHGAADDVADRLLTQSKAIGLLAYLLLSAPGVFQRRDRIVGLLWPEQDQQHARASLRKTIHVIRSLIGHDVLTARGDDDIVVNHELLGCDVVQLRAAIERGRLAAAVELYRGDLMPGFYLAACQDYDAWLEDRRSELHELAISTCMDLARRLESESSHTEAGAYARKAARLAGTNERILRRSMTMLDRLGDRAGALRVYEEFVRRLRQQMDASPSRETEVLAEALRTGKPVDGSVGSSGAG